MKYLVGRKRAQITKLSIRQSIIPSHNNDLFRWLTRIYMTRKHGFKLGLGFGLVLFNPVSQEYRYYYLLENNMLFNKAYTINSKTDLERFMKKVIALELATNCYLSKPSYGWVLSSITNVQAKITNLPKTMVGGGILPPYLQNSKSIIGLTHNRGEEYKDELCAFRCLALHHGSSRRGLEKYTQFLLQEFEKSRGKECKDGVSIYEIPLLELCFRCPINVYNLSEDGTVDPVYISPRSRPPLEFLTSLVT